MYNKSLRLTFFHYASKMQVNSDLIHKSNHSTKKSVILFPTILRCLYHKANPAFIEHDARQEADSDRSVSAFPR